MNLTTKRLVLKPITTEFIGVIFENFTDEVTTYMFPDPAKDIDETTQVVDMFINQREVGTDLVYAITLVDTGEFLGLAGLHGLKNKEMPELGIWTKLSCHGNHYGREAVGGVIEHAKNLGHKKLLYPVDRRNIASKKIPLYFNAELINPYKEEITPSGKVLEEEIYVIHV